jgi:hypothetical protein
MTDRFTIVFEGRIGDFKGNPFKTETPFGMPFVVSDGDLAAQVDLLEERIRLATDLLKSVFDPTASDTSLFEAATGFIKTHTIESQRHDK